MPTQLDGVSVTVNGHSAYFYYISPAQINILTPGDAVPAETQIVVSNNGAGSAQFTTLTRPLSPSFCVFSDGLHPIIVKGRLLRYRTLPDVGGLRSKQDTDILFLSRRFSRRCFGSLRADRPSKI
jgi:hypothetical protein